MKPMPPRLVPPRRDCIARFITFSRRGSRIFHSSSVEPNCSLNRSSMPERIFSAICLAASGSIFMKPPPPGPAVAVAVAETAGAVVVVAADAVTVAVAFGAAGALGAELSWDMACWIQTPAITAARIPTTTAVRFKHGPSPSSVALRGDFPVSVTPRHGEGVDCPAAAEGPAAAARRAETPLALLLDPAVVLDDLLGGEDRPRLPGGLLKRLLALVRYLSILA